jgi:hypothetical protein
MHRAARKKVSHFSKELVRRELQKQPSPQHFEEVSSNDIPRRARYGSPSGVGDVTASCDLKAARIEPRANMLPGHTKIDVAIDSAFSERRVVCR